MSAIRILAFEPWVERLGLTLLHFVWQGAVIASLYAAARGWTARRRDPGYRYFLGCAALAAMAIVPIVTWMMLPGPAHESAGAAFATPISAPIADSAASIPLFAPGNARAVPTGQTMAGLSAQFSALLDRRVVDRTHAEGTFDIHLAVDFNDLFARFNGGPAEGDASQRPDRIDPLGALGAAVRELGLRIESASDAQNFLVVDHVERPSEN